MAGRPKRGSTYKVPPAWLHQPSPQPSNNQREEETERRREEEKRRETLATTIEKELKSLSSDPVDLEGWPLIPLPSISRLGEEVLTRCREELQNLRAALVLEGDSEESTQLLKYVNKQLDAVQRELTQRDSLGNAGSGITIGKPKSVSLASSTSFTTKASLLSTPRPAINSSSLPVSSTPLPSLRSGRKDEERREKLRSPLSSLSSKEETLLIGRKREERERESASIDSAGIRQREEPECREEDDRGRFVRSKDQAGMQEKRDKEREATPLKEPPVPRAKGPTVRSKVNSNNRTDQSSEEALKSRRLKLINDTWGTKFVVPGFGKKKRRPLPKKKVVEDDAQRKERERMERRNAAAARLLERQKKMQEQRAKAKAQRKAQSLEEKEKETAQRKLISFPSASPVTSLSLPVKPIKELGLEDKQRKEDQLLPSEVTPPVTVERGRERETDQEGKREEALPQSLLLPITLSSSSAVSLVDHSLDSSRRTTSVVQAEEKEKTIQGEEERETKREETVIVTQKEPKGIEEKNQPALSSAADAPSASPALPRLSPREEDKELQKLSLPASLSAIEVEVPAPSLSLPTAASAVPDPSLSLLSSEDSDSDKEDDNDFLDGDNDVGPLLQTATEERESAIGEKETTGNSTETEKESSPALPLGPVSVFDFLSDEANKYTKAPEETSLPQEDEDEGGGEEEEDEEREEEERGEEEEKEAGMLLDRERDDRTESLGPSSARSAAERRDRARTPAKPTSLEKANRKEPVLPRGGRNVRQRKEETRRKSSSLSSPGKQDYSHLYRSLQGLFTAFYPHPIIRAKAPQDPPLQTMLKLQADVYATWKDVMRDLAMVYEDETDVQVSTDPFFKYFRVNSNSHDEVYDIIRDALRHLGDWMELPNNLGLNNSWNLLWTWSKPKIDYSTLLVWQKINHFPGGKNLSRKDLLKRNIRKMQSYGPTIRDAFDIIPETFVLPTEYNAFVEAFYAIQREKGQEKNLWIMKPTALSRGRGISLVSDLNDVRYHDSMVVQKYIANPLLLDGFKFDLRLYILVTSFNPLEAFLYKEGFARITTEKYTLSPEEMTNLFVHLTNSSINKHYGTEEEGEKEQRPPAAQVSIEGATSEDIGGTKASLSFLWRKLEERGVDTEALRARIREVIVKSLVAVEEQIPYQPNSFELFGYDILIDDQLRPWLIEANSSPSMARENALDYKTKDALIRDTVLLVSPPCYDRDEIIHLANKHAEKNSKRRVPIVPKAPQPSHGLNSDVSAILRGAVPRSYGEVPAYLGGYERLAPHTSTYDQVMKIKRTYIRKEREKPPAVPIVL